TVRRRGFRQAGEDRRFANPQCETSAAIAAPRPGDAADWRNESRAADPRQRWFRFARRLPPGEFPRGFANPRPVPEEDQTDPAAPERTPITPRPSICGISGDKDRSSTAFLPRRRLGGR